ncbi:MotA/TolQ/ExbB proton channel family protein [Orenia marismortui]|uniref:Biopolymer transport protein ExbB n=1 Tax=Orenia marismortui TaxID=46469 RepID=A0A4R8H6A0_9FIRM|nr:MotA/TolQ/ExbB proton channel family protein [Orenia marismortui]TDX52996.1 biopolymer transport protein ExbB [Orenia marismortui]
MQGLLAKGGIVIYPLLICSVIAMAIIIERLYRFSKVDKQISDQLIKRIKVNIKEGKIEAAIKVAEEGRGPITKVLKRGILHWNKRAEEIENQMEEVKLIEFPKLERYLGVLNFIGKITPSLGLLGTVTGMIKTFQILSMNGEAQQLAGGISEALFTTATGLIISLPTLAAYYFFITKLEGIVNHSERREIELINYIKEIGGDDEI